MMNVNMRLAVVLMCLSIITCEERTVTYVSILFRHGDRTPVNPYPTDPWKSQSLWPVKFGQLTNIGKSQHYSFGKQIRQRYSNIVSVHYDPDQIYVRSTDVDRTLMSAQANMAGFFPPKGDAIWDDTLIWQPIPIHTVPEHDDALLAMKKLCPAYNEELKKLKDSDEYKENLGRYSNLMSLLTTYTGMKVADYEDINDIYNTLFIENLYKLKLPPWTVTVFPEILRKPACYSFRVPTLTPKLARLKVGPLFTKITKQMLLSKIHSKSKLNMSIYSAHDLTVGSMLNAMGIFDGNCPVYTSAVFFELLQSDVNLKHYVRILYRNTTDNTEPTVLKIPGCGTECELSAFMKLYSNLLIKDWAGECNTRINSTFATILAITFLGAIFITVKVIITNLLNHSWRAVVKEYPDDVDEDETFKVVPTSE